MPPKKSGASLEPTWSRPACTGTVPVRRSGHTLTLCDEQDVCFLFGGMKLGAEGGTLTNELHRLSLQQGSMHWTKETAAGRVPPPTWRHTANLFDGGHILIFGGFTGEADRTDEVWVLNTEHMTWSRPVASAMIKMRPTGARGGNAAGGDNGGAGGTGGAGAIGAGGGNPSTGSAGASGGGPSSSPPIRAAAGGDVRQV